MSLCVKCYEFLFSIGRSIENDVPWIHCHHDQEKEICICYHREIGSPWYKWEANEYKYCPYCGRKLKEVQNESM